MAAKAYSSPLQGGKQILDSIINPDIKISGKQNAATQTKDDTLAIEELANSFLDAVNNASRKLGIKDGDCAENIISWANKNVPFLGPGVANATNATQKGFDWVNKNLNLKSGLSTFGDMGSGINKESLPELACKYLATGSRALEVWMDALLKIVITIFKKIDNYIGKLESALINFINDVRDCLLSTAIKAKLAITGTIGNVTNIDILSGAIEKCPCIKELLADLFSKVPCVKDVIEKGGTGEEIIACVTGQGLGIDTLVSSVNTWVQKNIIDTIIKIFSKIKDFVRSLIELLVAPLRLLTKAYCDLLNKKINMTWLIYNNIDKGKRRAGACFFIYTVEHKKNGTPYAGMSAIDILKTFKMWANCFEEICSTFSEDLKMKIKKYNEGLRLTVKDWLNPVTMDIFLACLLLNSQSGGGTVRAQMIRELFSRTHKQNPILSFGFLQDFFNGLTDVDFNEATLEEDLNELKSDTTPDDEDMPLMQGTLSFKKGVEKDLIQLINSLQLSIGEDGFFEKLSELVNWAIPFEKSQEFINAVEGTVNVYRHGGGTSVDLDEEASISTAPDISTSSRANTTETNYDNVLPTYTIVNDYDQISSGSDLNISRRKDEKRVDYYKRWYDAVT